MPLIDGIAKLRWAVCQKVVPWLEHCKTLILKCFNAAMLSPGVGSARTCMMHV